MTLRRFVYLLFALALSVLAAIGGAWFATDGGRMDRMFFPETEAWAIWEAHDPDDTRQFDFSIWDDFLRRRAPDGRVDWIAVSPADRAALDGWIDSLRDIGLAGYNRDEQRALWINLYNALIVRVVLEHDVPDTVLDIRVSANPLEPGPWGAPLAIVDGEAVSPDDIAHRILRPIHGDPRLHYVLWCGAVGCADLPGRALTGADGEAMLDAAARAFVNDPGRVRVEEGELIVSSLYVWYREDFGEDDEDIIAHIEAWGGPGLDAALARVWQIDRHEFDWSLRGEE